MERLSREVSTVRYTLVVAIVTVVVLLAGVPDGIVGAGGPPAPEVPSGM